MPYISDVRECVQLESLQVGIIPELDLHCIVDIDNFLTADQG
jgi:hypothetical protein